MCFVPHASTPDLPLRHCMSQPPPRVPSAVAPHSLRTSPPACARLAAIHAAAQPCQPAENAMHCAWVPPEWQGSTQHMHRTRRLGRYSTRAQVKALLSLAALLPGLRSAPARTARNTSTAPQQTLGAVLAAAIVRVDSSCDSAPFRRSLSCSALHAALRTQQEQHARVR